MSPSLAEQLTTAMSAIHRRGWCEGTGGNFSCVLQREPLQLLMAPSGVDKGSVQPEALIVVDQHGRVIQGEGKASAETALHLTIVNAGGAGAVLHTHSQAGTLLSALALKEQGATEAGIHLEGLEMLKGLEGIQTHETKVKVPVLANDQDLSRLSQHARPLIPGAPYGLLLAGHGLYAWADTLPQAIRHLEILEFLLEQHWRLKLLDALLNK
ncbi:MAG: methylthioribulose 1-phosphate dehydratase [Cyanobacteriota bacterium]